MGGLNRNQGQTNRGVVGTGQFLVWYRITWVQISSRVLPDLGLLGHTSRWNISCWSRLNTNVLHPDNGGGSKVLVVYFRKWPEKVQLNKYTLLQPWRQLKSHHKKVYHDFVLLIWISIQSFKSSFVCTFLYLGFKCRLPKSSVAKCKKIYNFGFKTKKIKC